MTNQKSTTDTVKMPTTATTTTTSSDNATNVAVSPASPAKGRTSSTSDATDKVGAVLPGAIAAAKTAQSINVGDDRGMRLAALRDLPASASLNLLDVRGWRIATSHGHIIGSVARIMVDQAKQNAPRYLDLLVDCTRAGILNAGSTVHILVPIGRAQVAGDGKSVVLPGLMTAQIPSLPRLSDGPVTWEHEVQVATAFGQTSGLASPDELYATEIFNDSFFRLNRAPST